MIQVPLAIERTATKVLDCCYRIHTAFGPGLLENAYEKVLASVLLKEGLAVETQKTLPILFEGQMITDAFRVDMIVNQHLLIELKAVSEMKSLFACQTQTYLRLLNLPLGLLLNFNVEHFRDGVTRIINPMYRAV